MNTYTKPYIEIKKFNVEHILTQSSAGSGDAVTNVGSVISNNGTENITTYTESWDTMDFKN